MTDEPLDLEHVRVLRVAPGDTLILTVPTDTTDEAAAGYMARMQELWPGNHCVVISADTELLAVRRDLAEFRQVIRHEIAAARAEELRERRIRGEIVR